MSGAVHTMKRGTRRVLDRLDAWANRLYGWENNPLYQSGTVAVASFVVLLVTGIWLLLFYRIGSPYASVRAITDQWWAGEWIRSLHRYASDVVVVAVAVHAVRMFAQGRSWGPRVLAWLSGVVLTGLVLVCGWTGYVMVWDGQALVLAREGARLLDVLPVFSEPIGRAFTGERAIPGAFFFLNLFLHIALPIGLALVLWIHVARVARPALLPPRKLLWGVVGLLVAVSVIWPVGLGPEAHPRRLTGAVDLDVFYSFWIPLARVLPPWVGWVVGGALTAAVASVPWWTRPSDERRPLPSAVDERLCTGCTQCALDCPYEAITMVARTDGRDTPVARVDPTLCVSCGICAGSCAPMGVGPPERTGRDQLADVKAFLAERRPGPSDVVVVGCTRGGVGARRDFDGSPVFPAACAGSVHTSVLEFLLRSGAGGVAVASCPERDCWNREGVRWLEQRVHHDREAELQERVDRRRVALMEAGAAEEDILSAALADFRDRVATLAGAEAEEEVEIDTECVVPPEATELEVEVER